MGSPWPRLSKYTWWVSTCGAAREAEADSLCFMHDPSVCSGVWHARYCQFLICNSVFALKHQDAKYIMFIVTLEMMQKQQNLTSDQLNQGAALLHSSFIKVNVFLVKQFY